MNRQQHIIDKFGVATSAPPPYHIAITGRQIPYLFLEMELKVGVEIGVERGKNAQGLLSKIPDLTLYCVDAWEYLGGYRESKVQKHAGYYDEAVYRLSPFGDRAKIIRKFSMDAVKDFEDDSLDFVWIDSNHEFQSVTNDIAEWSRKVRLGGIVAGHDFFRQDLGYEVVEVEDVVRAWTAAKGIDVWFVTQDPSWLWVKGGSQ
jgi:predicted O-methyltransferase YrrM